MPLANDVESASLALAAGLCMISLFLGLRQWYERRAREPDLSHADQLYYSRQDVRRNLGVAVLFGIALLVLVGSRVAPQVQGGGNLLFLQIWIAVMALIVILLILALADWTATRGYARRHRQELIRQSIEAIRREAREASHAQDPHEWDEHADPPGK
jgi:hypothetical protein